MNMVISDIIFIKMVANNVIEHFKMDLASKMC